MRALLLVLLVLGASLAVLPTAQACTAPPPAPLPDFHFLEWRDGSLVTVLGGSEAVLDVPSQSWSFGAPRTYRHACDPGPPRAGISDPLGAWVLAYSDEHRCCTGIMTPGPLRLLQGDEVVKEWSASAGWLALRDGVAIRDAEILDWVAFGDPGVHARVGALPVALADSAWAVAEGNSVAILGFGEPLRILDMQAGSLAEHPLPAPMQGGDRIVPRLWEAPEGGIVATANRHASWFNGTFSATVPGEAHAIHVVRGGILADTAEGVVAHARSGSSAVFEGDVESSAAGAHASAAALRQAGELRLVIFDASFDVVAVLERPQGDGVPGTSSTTPTTTSATSPTDANTTGEHSASAGLAALLAILLLAGRRSTRHR